MVKSLLAGLLALAAVSAQAQPPAPPINPSADTAEQRQSLRSFSNCVARYRPRWAREVLAKPYLSGDQARIAAYALSGHDSCNNGGREVEVTFRTSSLVSDLAEYFLRDELGRVDFARLSATLNTMHALNVSEEFAFCVAARNPAAARDLALSDFNTPAETAAAHGLAEAVAYCTVEGEHLTVDLQSLRALSAAALYRGVNTVLEAQD